MDYLLVIMKSNKISCAGLCALHGMNLIFILKQYLYIIYVHSTNICVKV